MGGDRVVLVLTEPYDVTADYVVLELTKRGVPVVRVDSGAFPQALTMVANLGGAWGGVLSGSGRQVQLEQVGCVYYRRPSAFAVPTDMNGPEARWATREARAGFGGVVASLPRWLNHPFDIAQAEYKPVQLAAAVGAGLDVPATLITNDPSAARQFTVEHGGQVVYKPLGGGGISEDGQHRIVYTTAVGLSGIDQSVTRTAHLFQQYLDKLYEVRLTVVDRRMFAARIDAESEAAKLDWRTDYDHLRYSVVDVPPRIASAVGRLLDRFRLRFSAIDFAVTTNGQWMFLDLNPNGQWAWLQDATGLPIAAAIADALQKGQP